MDREFPFPLPFSWYQVAYSDEIGVGELRPIHYFGRELVLFRDMAGTARVFDAFCPHLGAHIGYGGEVTEQGLRCPFHHWSFSPEDGRCVDIPYCKRIPPKAAVEPLPVCEKNGIIMAWYHPLGEPPEWEIPDLPEYGDPAWTEWTRRDWMVKSRNQELAENTVDAAHFFYVHGTKNIATTDVVESDGYFLNVLCQSRVDTSKGEADGKIDIHAYGLGFGCTRFKGVVETLVMTSGTPVDDEYVHMHLSCALRKLEDESTTSGVGKAFVGEIERQFSQDIPIWENKVHLEKPILCDGDGPIGDLRRWASKFYVD